MNGSFGSNGRLVKFLKREERGFFWRSEADFWCSMPSMEAVCRSLSKDAIPWLLW